jgi:hypothetical protein
MPLVILLFYEADCVNHEEVTKKKSAILSSRGRLGTIALETLILEIARSNPALSINRPQKIALREKESQVQPKSRP